MQLLYHHLLNRELVYLFIKTTFVRKIDDCVKESIYTFCLLNLLYMSKYLGGKSIGGSQG